MVEPGAHLVKAFGQDLDLVAGMNHQTMVQVAATDARRSRRQRPYGNDHAIGEPSSSGDRRQESESGDDGRTDERIVDRLQRLAEG